MALRQIFFRLIKVSVHRENVYRCKCIAYVDRAKLYIAPRYRPVPCSLHPCTKIHSAIDCVIGFAAYSLGMTGAYLINYTIGSANEPLL